MAVIHPRARTPISLPGSRHMVKHVSIRHRSSAQLQLCLLCLVLAVTYVGTLSSFKQNASKSFAESCTRLVTRAKTYSKARVIIFQKDCSWKLRKSFEHHSKVLGAKSIVIIDHVGHDKDTSRQLQYYATMGADIWRCEGLWARKHAMWSYVISKYAHLTDFIFPLDDDELLTVRDPDRNRSQLSWGQDLFFNSLLGLRKSKDVYKMPSARLIPRDCPNLPSALQTLPDEPKTSELFKLFEISCYSKCFSLGKAFRFTNQGNHALFTRTSEENRIALNLNSRTPCVEKYVNELFETENPFVLAHLQYSSFNDWLAHIIRGASDYGYNNFPDNRECKRGRSGVHYCRAFHKMLSAHFSYDSLHEQFFSHVCSTENAQLAYSRALVINPSR